MDDLIKEPTDEPTGGAAEQTSVFSQLERMIIDIIGDEAAEFIDISEQSTFVTDLEMDSIQIVQLVEQVNELYGRRVDFLSLLSDKSLSELLKLTVGDIVKFIETSI
ncbi:MAG: phosphopantetheine-binding protein [Coriobacteriales bacterium]|jgi:acyl carrier protein|nr:phosphopantetheine-binding protein [Coriobacteriales bacterium]